MTSPGELAAIHRAVREAFADAASGELRLTVSGLEIREMADGSGLWAVFANGLDAADREVYRRRICGRDGSFTTTDLPA